METNRDLTFRSLEEPSMPRVDVAEVSLDAYARRWIAARGLAHSHTANPLLDPPICQQMLDDLHAELGVRWSFGGYLEDRSFLWAASYMEEHERFIHLGIDVNAPAGTPLHFATPVRILRVDDDHPEPHGWGLRVIAEPLHDPEAPCIIYAHLGDVVCREGESYDAGARFAVIGGPPRNGGWFDHGHLQGMRRADMMAVLRDSRLSEVDGYGERSKRASLGERYPDLRVAISRSFVFDTFPTL